MITPSPNPSPNSGIIVMMTRDEATTVVERVKENVSAIGFLLKDFRDREGWRALGYSTFRESCEKQFADIYGSQSRIYRLIQQAEVIDNIAPGAKEGERPAINLFSSATLAEVEPSRQKQVFEEAKSMAGEGRITNTLIKKAAAKVAPQRKHANRKPQPEPKVSAPKFDAALNRIGHVCGKKVRAALIAMTIKPKEIVFWASLKDDEIARIEPLVMQEKWDPSKAWKAVNTMITEASTLQDLITIAKADGAWTGDICGFHITAEKKSQR